MPETANPKLRLIPPPGVPRIASFPGYAELAVTTNFSFLRGASHADELVYRAAELGYRAIAVTDRDTLAGAVRMHQAAKQTGLKLLIGSRLTFTDGPDVLVWVTDRAAYGRLCRLLTLGRRRAEKGECKLSLADLLEHQEGMFLAIVPPDDMQKNPPLLPLPRYSGGGLGWGSAANVHTEPPPVVPKLAEGDRECSPGVPGEGRKERVVGQRMPDEEKDAWTTSLRLLRHVVGKRLSLAIHCLHGPRDRRRLAELAGIAADANVPLLAINDVHYHDPSRRALQDVLTCIRHGCAIHDAGWRLLANAERYLKPPEQMHRLLADYPQAVGRTLHIAEQCTFSLDELRYEYPDELMEKNQTPLTTLRDLTCRGAEKRYPQGVPEAVGRQIEHELQLISQLRYEAYFLTVYDLVIFARSRGILCQGRGSAANSAVCYCLGVTSIDPVQGDLLFERFLSAARNEPPDIDIDFEHERREEVIQYVYEKYGRERAGMTATVITYRPRSAIRDVGKAMGLSLDLVDAMAKKIDWWDQGPIANERLRQIGIDPDDPTIKLIMGLTAQLLGFPRHLSQHVGGIVMTRGPLSEMVPIENASMEDRTVIQWDKDDIDALGILKVDVLALGMLTCISKCFKLLNPLSPCPPLVSPGRVRGEPSATEKLPLTITLSPEYQGEGKMEHQGEGKKIELHTVPPDDPVVYDMICNADTIGVFQIESRAQMTMLPRLKPRNFYDLVIEVAIVRPGPIQGDMVHPYLRRRRGEEKVEYPSEALRGILQKTLGVPLFQEQAMKIAMVAAGFSAEEADQLRRAMAAWRYTGHIEKFHRKIVDGMVANGYTPEFAQRCFDQIKGFGEYGFPESHAASFALLAYASAWLKCHYPAAFACALLNSQPMGFYAPAQIVRDAREHGVEVRHMDVNQSLWDCTLEDAGDWPALRLGFRQIKGLSQADGERIAAARQAHGLFRSVAEFQQITQLSRQAIRRLAHADAFGSINLSRRPALWQSLALSDAPAPLFDCCPDDAPPPGDLPKMPIRREVLADYATAGLSLKRHPVSLVRPQLIERRIVPAKELKQIDNGRWIKVAGLVLCRQHPGTANGIVFVTLEDETGVANLIIRPQIYDRYRLAARHATLLQADGYLQREGKVIHLLALRLHDLTDLLLGQEPAEMPKSRDFH